jgi:hypothetical protein
MWLVAVLSFALLMLIGVGAAHLSAGAAAHHVAWASIVDDYTLCFGLMAVLFAMFALQQTIHTLDAVRIQVEQAEAARTQGLDASQLRELLEQSRLDPKILTELAAALRERKPAVALSVVAFHGTDEAGAT